MAIGRRTARPLARSLIACGALVTSLLPGPASGALIEDFRDHRMDPDEGTLLSEWGYEEGWVGVRSATLSVWTNAEGRRWLRVAIFPFAGYSHVRLDTDGDRAADVVISFDAASEGYCWGRGHGVRERGHYAASWGGDPDVVDGFYACTVPLAFLQASGPIAWWVRSYNVQYASDDPDYTDRAPNVGWYV